MNGKERREKIIELIKKSDVALSGTELSKSLNVSRQVIVQDIALLRTAGFNIISTTKGYLLISVNSQIQRVFKVKHSDEQIEEELLKIIDLGGTIVDIFVSHRAYGLIRAELNIKTHQDVNQFMDGLKTGKSSPLKNITHGYHYHTITAKSHHELDRIYQMLLDEEYLVSIDDWDWQYISFSE